MKNYKQIFIDLFDLSSEVVLDLPLVMMLGKKKVYLENHKGIIKYQSDEIKIRLHEGYFIVKGTNLTISEITSSCLSIGGNITQIGFE